MHINYLEEWRKNKSGQVGFFLLAVLVLAAILGPVLSPYSPTAHSILTLQPPSEMHWLGTNDVGQDILSRLVAGARTSLLVATGAALLSTLIGAIVGMTAAMTGGAVDKILMRITDALLTIPVVVVVIMIAAYIRPGVLNLVIIFSLLGWPVGARVVRAQTLSLKEYTHIYAVRTFGGGMGYIIARHILPDLLPLLCANFIQGARRAVFMEAGLAFLGVVNPGVVSWGVMLRHALEYCYLDVYKWWLLPTGFTLSLTILAFTLIGYFLEEISDPGLRRR